MWLRDKLENIPVRHRDSRSICRTRLADATVALNRDGILGQRAIEREKAEAQARAYVAEKIATGRW